MARIRAMRLLDRQWPVRRSRKLGIHAFYRVGPHNFHFPLDPLHDHRIRPQVLPGKLMAGRGKFHPISGGRGAFGNVHFQGCFANVIRRGAAVLLDRLFHSLKQHPGMAKAHSPVGWRGGFLVFFVVTFQVFIDDRTHFFSAVFSGRDSGPAGRRCYTRTERFPAAAVFPDWGSWHSRPRGR